MRKKLIFGIIICTAIALLITGIILVLKFDQPIEKEKRNIPKMTYKVNLEDSKGFTIKPTPYNGNNELALFITSDTDYSSVNIEINFLDTSGQIINTNKVTNNFVNAKKSFLITTAVDTTKTKIIQVKIIPEVETVPTTNEDPRLDRNKLSFKTEDKIDLENNVTISLISKNPYNQTINLINGYVLLYDEDILVDTIFFSTADVKESQEITASVNAKLQDTTGIFKYDKIKVIVNELF